MKDIRSLPESLLSSSTRIKSYPRASVFEVKYPSIGYSKHLRKYNTNTRRVGVQINEVTSQRGAFHEGCIHAFGIPYKSLFSVLLLSSKIKAGETKELHSLSPISPIVPSR